MACQPGLHMSTTAHFLFEPQLVHEVLEYFIGSQLARYFLTFPIQIEKFRFFHAETHDLFNGFIIYYYDMAEKLIANCSTADYFQLECNQESKNCWRRKYSAF